MTIGGNRRSPGLALASLLVAAVAACGDQPLLRTPTDNSASVAMSNVAHGEPRSVGSMELCLTAPGTATITAVALHEATGNIRVDAFGVRPSPYARGLNGIGAQSGTLDEVDGEEDPWVRDVDTVCPTAAQIADPDGQPALNEFAVQVSWSSGEWSGGAGLDVTYEVDGVEHTTVVPFGVWLCAGTCPDDLGS